MSTKTLRKRIALVAVTALGAGLLSVAPASAAMVGTPLDGIATVQSGSVCAALNDAGAAITAPWISDAVGANLVVPVGSRLLVALDANDNMEITGPLVASELDVDLDNDTVVQSVNSKGRILIDDPGATDENFILTATGAGSATLVVSADGASTTPTSAAANTISITIVAACTSSVFSVADSFTYVKGADATAAVTATNVDTATSASAGSSLYINVTGKNAYGTAMTSGTYAASATNGALVSWGNAATTAPSKGTVSVSTITPDGTDILRISPASSLVTSTTTVTITHNGTPVTTKSLTFFGEAASIEVVKTSAGKTSTTGAGTTTGFFLYQYKDTAGNVVPGSGAAIDATTATASVTTATSEKAPTAAAAAVTGNLVDAIETAIGSVTYGAMSFACGSTAGTSTITIKHTNAISAAVISKTVALSCFGGLDTYTVSTDKAKYAVGEIATITITAKDSKGNPVADSTLMSADSVSVGGGTLTKAVAATDAFTGGVRTYKAQMTTGGTFNTVVSVTGTTTTSATTSYSVSSGEVALADVLKAIVSLIASINKQIAALQKALLKK